MRFLKRTWDALVPSSAALEASARQWAMSCPSCGHSKDLWDAGGVRYRAVGEKRTYGYCSQCGRSGWLRVHLKDNR